MFLHLTTLLNLDQEPIGTVDAQFVGGARSNTFIVVATTPNNTGGMVDLHPYGPFATDDDARAWAAAHLAPYMTFTVAPLATPDTNATADTPPPVVDATMAADEAAHALFDAVLRAAREKASDDPDDYDLMDEIQDMDTPDALAALKNASLPTDMIGPIADALALLAPHTYSPAH
ncbi:hypothetical protein [Streptomyces syringium]|uniref:hypothetical protein n=1 Tax=Streptomyces syringium TaxID=76729 RepID=UPI003447FD72